MSYYLKAITNAGVVGGRGGGRERERDREAAEKKDRERGRGAWMASSEMTSQPPAIPRTRGSVQSSVSLIIFEPAATEAP